MGKEETNWANVDNLGKQLGWEWRRWSSVRVNCGDCVY